MRVLLRLVSLLLAAPLAAQAPKPVPPPAQDYLLFVGSEGDDRVQLVRFGPGGATVERWFRMSTNPTELVGPHGIGVAPGGGVYYVSTAHGTPHGSLWKYTTAGDTLKGRVELGSFPATLQVSPDGAYVYVVNFALHGDMKPSSVSVVYGPEMVEVARIQTCTMPHGSRLNAQGTRHYSACMMDDMLVEIDTRALAVSRHFLLSAGREHGMTGPMDAKMLGGHASPAAELAHAGPHAAAHGGNAGASMAHGPATCSPTWAQPSPDGAKVYVACNKASDIVEIDVPSWTMARRFPAGEGVYNLAITKDGRRLVATNKRGQSVSVFDLPSGKELARIPTARKVASGVVLSPDDRYAFVTVEGVGAQPGTVEMIDLQALASVARVDVGPMAGGIDVWKVERAR